MVSEQPDFKADAAGLSVTQGRGGGGVGDGNDNVCIHRAFLCQLLTHLAADLVATLFENLGVRAAEVDVFENAVGQAVFLDEPFGMEPVVCDGEELAGLDVPDVVGSQQIEGAGLGGDTPGFSHAGDGQRAEPEAIAGHLHGVLADENQAETSGEFGDGFLDGLTQIEGFCSGNFMKKDFGVRGGLEDVPLVFHLLTQFGGVGDVSVVDYRQLAPLAAHQNGLGVCKRACPCGAVTDVAYAGIPRAFVYVVFLQEGGHQPHGLADTNLIAVGYGKARGFLAPVLQRIQPHGNIADNVFAIENADDSAFFMNFFEHNASLKM